MCAAKIQETFHSCVQCYQTFGGKKSPNLTK
jgi:hypothetical protein